jgi:hypothetical protein
MSRDLSPAVALTLDGKPLRLHLDMTALYDFEEEAGITVGELLRPAVGILQGALDETGAKSFEDLKSLPAEQQQQTGMAMIERLLNSGVLEARRLLVLVWAMAGGRDTEQTPREFGRLLNWANRAALVAAFGAALRNGFPPADEDEDAPAAAPAADDAEDPTPRPES